MENIIEEISKTVLGVEHEYLKDGLLHCCKCNRATQVEVEFMNKKKVVRCICDCRKKELEEFEERKKFEERERRRSICFSENHIKSYTFDKDDKNDMRLSNAMIKYVENFDDFKKSGEGLLLYGNVGTGKTFYTACIANKLIDEGYHVLLTSFSKIVNELQGMFKGKQEYMDSLNQYSLLILDDLGIERHTEYMQEHIYNIVDSRYRTGLPFIITTNLTLNELKNPQDLSYARIYDRILERCFPIMMNGVSRRRETIKDNYFSTKQKLGL